MEVRLPILSSSSAEVARDAGCGFQVNQLLCTSGQSVVEVCVGVLIMSLHDPLRCYPLTTESAVLLHVGCDVRAMYERIETRIDCLLHMWLLYKHDVCTL